uniref:F-box domain-containing protein n=1 Tax=Glossina pallidipes TaxID=7398 RepID=A0A1B0AGC5_GLOPL
MSKNSPGIRHKSDQSEDGKTPAANELVLLSNPMLSTDKTKANQIQQQQQQEQRLEMPLPPENANLECLLVLDTTSECAPLHLQYVLSFTDSFQSAGEILFMLVYTVALESGYMCEADYDVCKDFISPLSAISSFHSKNVLRLSRLKPTFTVSMDRTRYVMKLRSIIDSRLVVTEKIYALLTAIVSGDLMILALSPANCMYADGFSSVLSIPRYVLNTQSKENPPFQRFRKMAELTNILRDELFVPMRNKQLYWMQAHVYPSLDALPAELYEYFLKHLDKNQMNILANVDRSLHNIVVRICVAWRKDYEKYYEYVMNEKFYSWRKLLKIFLFSLRPSESTQRRIKKKVGYDRLDPRSRTYAPINVTSKPTFGVLMKENLNAML